MLAILDFDYVLFPNDLDRYNVNFKTKHISFSKDTDSFDDYQEYISEVYPFIQFLRESGCSVVGISKKPNDYINNLAKHFYSIGKKGTNNKELLDDVLGDCDITLDSSVKIITNIIKKNNENKDTSLLITRNYKTSSALERKVKIYRNPDNNYFMNSELSHIKNELLPEIVIMRFSELIWEIPNNKLLKINELPILNHCLPKDYYIQIVKILSIRWGIAGDFYLDEPMRKVILLYWKYLKSFPNKNIYSLGDSLDKLNVVWEYMYNDSKIKNIPFSGNFFNAYDHYDDGEIFELNKELYDNIILKLPKLVQNNKMFAELLTKIKSGEQVLLTDFAYKGRVLFTLDRIFEKLKIDASNLIILLVSENPKIIENNIKRLGLKSGLKVEQINIFHYDHYFGNSESSNSRCISKYNVDLWDNSPDIMWKNKKGKYNYFLCNLHRTLIVMMLCNESIYFKQNHSKLLINTYINHDNVKVLELEGL